MLQINGNDMTYYMKHIISTSIAWSLYPVYLLSKAITNPYIVPLWMTILGLHLNVSTAMLIITIIPASYICHKMK